MNQEISIYIAMFLLIIIVMMMVMSINKEMVIDMTKKA